ncbi:hypothetical protein [Flavobacterium nitrogenifigens]|nr:hypothetical protein [Flavobacterium nitrogenifigens]KAF2340116.1 hypothetical protein DM397_00630 [Flavobacterium nitrogenifigens]
MRKHYIPIYLLTCFWLMPANGQVSPNSNKFDVESFIALANNGSYYPYKTHGFYENAPSGARTKIFLLPILSIDLKKIKFIDKSGKETVQSSDNVRTIIIPVNSDLKLPNESQKAAITAAIGKKTSIGAFKPPIARNAAGLPILNNAVSTNPSLYNQIMTMATNYENAVIIPQQQLINEYNNLYDASIVSLDELEIIIEAGGETVYTKRMPGTTLFTGGKFNSIALESPNEYVKNLIAEGNAQIFFSYKFRDSKKSTISASMDASRTIDHFLNESYKSSAKQKSGGWSFLGLGSSRKSMKTSFDQQISEQYADNSISNTTIEMYDADDSMIQTFENIFFPKLTQDQAIENHLKAADKAAADGNAELQNLHLKYVEMLQKNDPNLSPDIEAAVAALNKNDYVGFIANGVRWGNNKSDAANSYRRVLNSSEMTSKTQTWNQNKTISVQHAVIQPIIVQEPVNFVSSLGLIDAIEFNNSLAIYNGYSTNMQNIQGIILGPITAGSALQKNSILPGTLITRIGSYDVHNPESYLEALNHYNPGDKIYITKVAQVGPNPNIYQKQNVEVTLGAYPEIK